MDSARSFGKLSLLFLLTITLVAVGCDEKNPRAVATPPPVVMVAYPVERTVTDYQIFTARTQAVQSVDIKARVTGYLTKINFKDGAVVKEGDVLFQIDDRPYKAALDDAKAMLEFSNASLIKAQADYDIGINVQKANKGAISVQEIDKRLGARDESKASVDKAKAQLENAQLNYDWCKVTAPISGLMSRHFVDAGNLVSQDTTLLANIVSLKPVWAYFDVDENTVRRYQKLVQQGKLKSARDGDSPVAMSLAGDQGFPINGVIDYVSNQLDPNTGSIQVRAVFPNEDGTIAAGLFGRIRVPITEPQPALLVADAAVGTNQGQRYVLVVDDKNVVDFRPVDVGQVFDGLREVKRYRTIITPGPDGKDATEKVEALKATDRVIVDGLQRVRPGATVEPRLVDMVTQLTKPVGQPKTPPATAPKKQ